jgi:hypothetical protein
MNFRTIMMSVIILGFASTAIASFVQQSGDPSNIDRGELVLNGTLLADAENVRPVGPFVTSGSFESEGELEVSAVELEYISLNRGMNPNFNFFLFILDEEAGIESEIEIDISTLSFADRRQSLFVLFDDPIPFSENTVVSFVWEPARSGIAADNDTIALNLFTVPSPSSGVLFLAGLCLMARRR